VLQDGGVELCEQAGARLSEELATTQNRVARASRPCERCAHVDGKIGGPLQDGLAVGRVVDAFLERSVGTGDQHHVGTPVLQVVQAFFELAVGIRVAVVQERGINVTRRAASSKARVVMQPEFRWGGVTPLAFVVEGVDPRVLEERRFDAA
jgi:hypothetical protein